MTLRRYGLFLAATALASAAGCVGRAMTNATRESHADVINLAGDWRFATDEPDAGLAADWAGGPLPGARRVELPGTNFQWRVGQTPPPADVHDTGRFGWTPTAIYEGVAWFQRDVVIPPAWAGRRVTLELEQVRGDTRAWLDGRPVDATQENLTTPHVHDLSALVSPGRHVLTLAIDNRRAHGISGSYVKSTHGQNNWNGVAGRIELRATDRAWIDALHITPDVEGRAIDVVARVGNTLGETVRGTIALDVLDASGTKIATQRVSIDVPAGGGEARARVPLGDAAKPWDEFTPTLYSLRATLASNANVADVRQESFGLRSVARDGRRILINGQPQFFRGTVSYGLFADTGYPHADVESWRKIFRAYRDWGMNHVRFHSWTPPEAAFVAADELGMYLQPEAPRAGRVGINPADDAFVSAEGRRIVERFGNHPSFVMLSMGNEMAGSTEALQRIVDGVKPHDPGRRLYAAATGGKDTDAVDDDFKAGGARGVRGPSTDWDFAADNARYTRPVITHEVGQWHVYPDVREIPKFTGVMRPGHLEAIRDDLARKHLSDDAADFTRQSGQFAAELYKEEVESLLRTPDHSGYQLLMLSDFSGQGAATVGMLNLFNESKGLVDAAWFRRFCAPVVPLLRVPKRTFAAGETLTARAQLSNHGPRDLTDAFVWRLADGKTIVAEGRFAPTTIARGALADLGAIEVKIPEAPAGRALTLTIASADGAIANDWSIWTYPSAAATKPSNMRVATHWKDARAALLDGETVLFYPPRDELAAFRPGAFKSVFWSPVWLQRGPETLGIRCDPSHPALAGFPTAAHSDWQWFELLERSSTIVIDALPRDFKPVVAMIDSFRQNQRLANVFEARVGKGRLMVCSIDLPGLQATSPAARQLLRSLTTHLAKDAPTQSLDVSALDALFNPTIVRRDDAPTDSAALFAEKPNVAPRAEAGWTFEFVGEAKPLADGSAWAAKKDMRLLVRAPKATGGTLWLRMHNATPTTQPLQTAEEKRGVDYVEETTMGLAVGEAVDSIYLNGKLAGTLRGFGRAGKWFGVPVPADAFVDGVLDVRFCTLNEPHVVSSLAFVPAATTTRPASE